MGKRKPHYNFSIYWKASNFTFFSLHSRWEQERQMYDNGRKWDEFINDDWLFLLIHSNLFSYFPDRQFSGQRSIYIFCCCCCCLFLHYRMWYFFFWLFQIKEFIIDQTRRKWLLSLLFFFFFWFLWFVIEVEWYS